MNSPQWGPDNWIYIDGGQGGRITGPKLNKPINLPSTAFRIKPDGSAIEAVSGHTSTYGFTFNKDGDRIVISTGTPGIQVAPLPWRYLSRNRDIAVRASRRNAANYNTTFPTSEHIRGGLSAQQIQALENTTVIVTVPQNQFRMGISRQLAPL